MSVRYNDDFKKEVVKAYIGGKSSVQLSAEYNVAKSSIIKWVKEYSEECRYTTNTTPESNDVKEIRRLNQLLTEKDNVSNKQMVILIFLILYFHLLYGKTKCL